MVLRGKSSSSSSTPAPSVAAGRLPILLQITDATLAAGHVGQPLPLHIQPLLDPPCPAAYYTSTSSGAALYSYLADPLTSLFHRLLGTKVAASGVIVLHSHGIYVNATWKLAIARLLNDLLKVPKVCFVSTLHTLPALISHSHSVLVVHFVSSSLCDDDDDDDNDDNGINKNYHRAGEVQCMVTAVDHDPLEYTFQSVPRRRRRRHRTTITGRKEQEENVKEDEETMDDDDDGAVLVRAICLSLIACPRSHRKSAIQNIIVDHPNDDDENKARQHGTRIVRKLYDYLTSSSTSSSDDDLPRSDDDNDVLVPIRRDEIKALAPYIGLVEFQSTFRLAYLGASVLATSSSRRDWPWQDINGI
jgi:hypothetical protein